MAGAVQSIARAASSRLAPVGNLIRATEVDLRLFGMVVALALILFGFGAATGGKFLEPVNILTLSVQAASVAIIATGMVLSSSRATSTSPSARSSASSP